MVKKILAIDGGGMYGVVGLNIGFVRPGAAYL